MANPIPSSYQKTVSLAEKMIAGLHEYETPLGVMHNTASVMEAALAAANVAEDAFHGARGAKRSSYQQQGRAMAAAEAFIVVAVDSLKSWLGRQWSAAWTQVGFNQSLALPKTFARRLEVLRSLETYLTGHAPVEEPAKGLTHQAAKGLREALRDAVNNVTACATEARKQNDARTVAVGSLRRRMRGLVKELSGLMSETDPRWKAFGLNIPADPAVPAKVADLALYPEAAGEVSAEWDASARAGRYYVEILVGEETEFNRVATVFDTNANLTGLLPGASVKLRVVAVNDGGEGVPSEVVEVVVPALALAA